MAARHSSLVAPVLVLVLPWAGTLPHHLNSHLSAAHLAGICPTAPSGTDEFGVAGPYAVSVTPKGSPVTQRANTNGLTANFTVTNTGSCPDTLNFTATVSGPVTVVSVSPSSYSGLQPGTYQIVVVTYNVSSPGSGTLTLTAAGNASDNGSYNVTVQAPYSVSVTPDGATAPTRPATTGGYSQVFTVQNTGYNNDTYTTITCGSTGSVTCTRVSPTTLPVVSGASQTDTAWYNVGTQGSGTLTLRAASANAGDSGWYSVPVGPPPGAPVVDATPYNYAKQDYAMCAYHCFATVYTQSTIPYISFDTPRSMTLAYNSDRVNPRPFVLVNVIPDANYGQAPSEYRVQVKVNGAFVTFLNGDQTLRFAYPGSAAARLGAQFDASSDTTGVYPMDVLVSAYYAGTNTLLTNDLATKLVIVNETNSVVAAGWTLAGVQRLHSQADGSALVTQGDGSAVYFASVNGTFQSPAGEFSTLITSNLSGTNGWARIYPDSSKAVFDNTGKLVQLRDRFNNITNFAYDGSGRVVSVKDPANLRDTLVYGANGLASIQDPGTPARTTTVTVDGSRHITAITDPDNVSTNFVFDANVLLWKVIDRRGDTTQYGYDNGGKLIYPTFPPVMVYGSGSPIRLSESYYPWQEVGVPYTSTATTPASAPRADTVWARVIDPRGYTTVLQVDRFGAITRRNDAAGRTSSFTRDSNSTVIRDSLPSGHVIRHTWSGPNLTQVWDSTTGRTINYAYESTWNQLTQISGDADSIWNYWSHAHLDSTIAGTRATGNPLRRLSTFTYDALGRLLTSTDPAGHSDTSYYDATPWRNTDSTRAGGRRVAYTYDGFGRLATTKTPRGDITTVHYDQLNRQASRIGPLADTTTYSYDSLFLRQVRDPIGQVYQFSRNALGWLASRTDASGKQDQYQYDKNGNVRQWTNRRGQVVAWDAYDALNRPTAVTADGKRTTLAYDAGDRYVADSNAESMDTVRFNVAGWLQSQIAIHAGTRYELASHVNPRGLRDTLRAASPWADTVAYHYDASMALDTLRDLAGGRTALTYDHHLFDSTVVLPNGLGLTRRFPSTHVSAQTLYTSGTISAAIGAKYDFDSLGLVADGHQVGSNDSAATAGRDYTYDAVGQLTRYGDYVMSQLPQHCDDYDPNVGYPCTGGQAYKSYSTQESYTYDKVGNRKVVPGDTVAPGNRLVRFNGDSLVYDADGNLVTRIRAGSAIQRLYWSSQGLLDSAWTNGVGTVGFGYDALGRRVRKTFGSTITGYVYDGDNLVAEVDGGTPTTPLAEYTYYPGVDQPYSLRRRMRSDSVFYYAQDFPGNVVGLLNAGQTLVAQYKYKPYGADNGSSPGAVPNPFRFAARQLDSEMGLYYMRARYYDPQLGRFVSEDPIGLAGGINAYVYAGNNPVNGRDPNGKCHPNKDSAPAHAAGGGDCGGDGGGGGSAPRGFWGWFGADDSPDYGDVSGGYWTTADVWDFYNWAMAQPGDQHSSDDWIAAGRPKYIAPLNWKQSEIWVDYTDENTGKLYLFKLKNPTFQRFSDYSEPVPGGVRAIYSITGWDSETASVPNTRLDMVSLVPMLSTIRRIGPNSYIGGLTQQGEAGGWMMHWQTP